MAKDSNQLNIRITLDRKPELAAPESDLVTYRWDRILIAAALLCITLALLVWFLLSPQQKVTAPSSAQSAPLLPKSPRAEKTIAERAENTAVQDKRQAATVPRPSEKETQPKPAAAQRITKADTKTQTQQSQEQSSQALLTNSRHLPAPPNTATSSSLRAGKLEILEPATVVRFILTDGLLAREPVGTIADITIAEGADEAVRVYAFSEIHNLAGRPVYYRWLHEGREVARVRVDIGSDSWRNSSTKLLNASMQGQWRVELKSAEQRLLAYAEFYY